MKQKSDVEKTGRDIRRRTRNSTPLKTGSTLRWRVFQVKSVLPNHVSLNDLTPAQVFHGRGENMLG